MKLGELLRGVPTLQSGADTAAEITSLAYDSRRVKPGTLFFAIQGDKADGHDFVPQALEAGAKHLLLDNLTPEEAAGWIRHIAGRAITEISGGVTINL